MWGQKTLMSTKDPQHPKRSTTDLQIPLQPQTIPDRPRRIPYRPQCSPTRHQNIPNRPQRSLQTPHDPQQTPKDLYRPQQTDTQTQSQTPKRLAHNSKYSPQTPTTPVRRRPVQASRSPRIFYYRPRQSSFCYLDVNNKSSEPLLIRLLPYNSVCTCTRVRVCVRARMSARACSIRRASLFAD